MRPWLRYCIKAGKSGQYIVKPQVGESGPDQEYHEVNHEDRDDSTSEMKFRGTILTFAEDIWTVRIGDEVRTVNVAEAEIEGTAAEGRLAKIEGMVGEDDIILASEVEIKGVKAESESETEETEAEEVELEKLKFEGIIVGIDGNTWTVKIGNENRTVNVEGAEIEGEPAVELKARIEGTVGEDDIIVASEVEIKGCKPKEVV